MNENPEGTPNPLNPNPEAAPVAPEPVAPVAEQAMAEPTVGEQTASLAEPVAQPTQPVQPDNKPVAVGKPKKTGLIIAIVLFILAIATGVTAALIVLNPFGGNKDAVPAAMAKLMSGDAPKLVAMEGNIKLTSSNEESPVSALAIKFQTGLNGNTKDNYATAIVTATFKDSSELTFNADEIGTANGDLYLKLSNIAEALNNYEPATVQVTDCEDGEETEKCIDYVEIECDEEDEDCDEEDIDVIMPEPADSILDFIGVFEVIDDEWVRIPSSDFSNVTDLVSVDMPTQCLIDAAGNLQEYGSNFATMYSENPFINYTTDDLKIAQKKDTLYQLKFDADKLAGFINSMNNSGFMNEMLACMGGQATNEEVSASDLQGILAVLPEIYVEIDNDNNFTRVYLALTSEDGQTSVTADLSLSYPANITIQEPEVYIEMNEVLSRLFTMFYGEDVYDFTMQ